MKINLEAAEVDEISDIHTKLLRVSFYKIRLIIYFLAGKIRSKLS